MLEQSRGRLIVFEGVDAAGKTTLCDDLCDSLQHRQQPFQRYHFPGKTHGTLGELVYRIHHHHRDEFFIHSVNSCALQLLHIAAHIDIIESAIKQAMSEGLWVVLDRFWWSTYVYGRDSGVSEQSLELMIQLEKRAWGTVLPDILLLIDSSKPLRDDESNCAAWHRKRGIYAELMERERAFYSCVVIETERGLEGMKSASEKILRKVLL
jgi:thymidylate kinase